MDNDQSKTPIENPTAKEWFSPDYVPSAPKPTNVIRRNFGPGLPVADPSDEATGGEVS